MAYIKRSLERKFLKMSGAFKVVMVTGARQVGKSTMLKHLAEYSGRKYISMDDADLRKLANQDPKLFFQMYQPPVLIDEVQKAPALFEEIKKICDTGLCAYLSSWTSRDTLMNGAASGHFFENYVVAEMIRNASYGKTEMSLNFYRDKKRKEIDLLIEIDGELQQFEIKRSASPERKAIRAFGILERSNRKVGSGGIICMVETPLPIDANNSLIPVNII